MVRRPVRQEASMPLRVGTRQRSGVRRSRRRHREQAAGWPIERRCEHAAAARSMKGSCIKATLRMVARHALQPLASVYERHGTPVSSVLECDVGRDVGRDVGCVVGSFVAFRALRDAVHDADGIAWACRAPWCLRQQRLGARAAQTSRADCGVARDAPGLTVSAKRSITGHRP